MAAVNSITPLTGFFGPSGTPGAGGNANAFGFTFNATKDPINSVLQGAAGNLVDAIGLGNAAKSTIGGAVDAITGTAKDVVAAPGKALSAAGSALEDVFLRGTIIILGFIFVAVALTMFKPPAVISQTTAGFRRVGGAIRRAAP